MTATPRNQRGFALLVVLWTVALLALLGTWLIAAARERTAIASDLRTAAAMESVTDGATQHAIFEILKGRWIPNESTRTIRIGAVNVSVFLEDEALKLNPNYASATELQALLQRLSVDRRFAATLAAAIVDWRTPGGTLPAENGSGRNDPAPAIPFARLADLATVPGMTPDVMQRLLPHLTLFAGNDPDLVPATGDAGAVNAGAVNAGAVNAGAVNAGAVNAGAVNAMHVIGIIAVAHGPNQAMFARHVIVRTNARRSGPRYEVLLSERDNPGPEPKLNAERISVTP
jgi:general secretion pathway protein K